MGEIGGYIELDRYNLPMLHEGALALNCGRNALSYLIKAKNIKSLMLPKFLCDSVGEICRRESVEIEYYSISENFKPKEFCLDDNQWLYLVNFYGQLDNDEISRFSQKHKRVIVDNAQAYFQEPVPNVDTLYTCRKFFGVADGAFLYTDTFLDCDLERDESFDRMRFLLGRFERSASEFYSDYVSNNRMFAQMPIRQMSKLTENLLHAVDYENISRKRSMNFEVLHNAFSEINRLCLNVPRGAFMYPFYVHNGAEIRKKLQEKSIYIPTLWPDVFNVCKKSELEYDMAENILPLPVDQRYANEDMQTMISEIKKLFGE